MGASMNIWESVWEERERGSWESARVLEWECVQAWEKEERVACVSVSVLVASLQKRDGYVTARVCLNYAHSYYMSLCVSEKESACETLREWERRRSWACCVVCLNWHNTFMQQQQNSKERLSRQRNSPDGWTTSKAAKKFVWVGSEILPGKKWPLPVKRGWF